MIEKTEKFKVGLIGNPNCGKSTLFNQLTGLKQKIGNYPGITVDKKTGTTKVGDKKITIIDFPGAYSLYPNSQDERIVLNTLTNPDDANYPDLVVYVADICDLEKHLLLFTQIIDLNIPVIFVMNMLDIAEKEHLDYNIEILRQKFQTPIIPLSSRLGKNINALKDEILKFINNFEVSGNSEVSTSKKFYTPTSQESQQIKAIKKQLNVKNDYRSLLMSHHFSKLPFLDKTKRETIGDIVNQNGFNSLHAQIEETRYRYSLFAPVIKAAVKKNSLNAGKKTITDRIDDVLTNNIAGPLIFFVIIFFIFQAIFSWATYPMDLIDTAFGYLSEQVQNHLPEGWFTDLLTEGVLAGLGGILIFIPQIAILFFLISILEEAGYMARAAYIFDKIMQKFGLNGRSVVALISGGACAIPAIMSTRTIGYWKERLITILVTPFISCSARIPVYAVLIALVVPDRQIFGLFNLQGLAFMGLYLLGIAGALISAMILNRIIKSRQRSFLALELPDYRLPVLKNILLNVWDKVKVFVLNAGKIILIISIALWFLASFGPGDSIQNAENDAISISHQKGLDKAETANFIASKKLEASYAGHFGKIIEPVIKPLGYDWKIGIALLTSFAAREVFVGTIATIYSIGSDDELSVRQRMATEINPVTGEKVYSPATSFSLLIFYVFAMQCMATFAIVKRETNSWKWPFIQFFFMLILAYLGAFVVYSLF